MAARKKKSSALDADQFFPNDEELIRADRERKALKSQAATAEETAKKVAQKIIATLQARKTKKIIHQGWRVTLVEPSGVEIDYLALLRLLTGSQKRRVVRRTLTLDLNTLSAKQISDIKQSLGVRRYRLGVTEDIDPDAVSQAVQDGVIDAELVASCSEVVPKTPYLNSGESSE